MLGQVAFFVPYFRKAFLASCKALSAVAYFNVNSVSASIVLQGVTAAYRSYLGEVANNQPVIILKMWTIFKFPWKRTCTLRLWALGLTFNSTLNPPPLLVLRVRPRLVQELLKGNAVDQLRSFL